MSEKKDKVIDAANAAASNGIILTVEKFDLRRVTKEELHERLQQQSTKARDMSQKLQEAYTEIATLKETGSDIMNGQSVLAKSLEDAQAKNADLQVKVRTLETRVSTMGDRIKELDQWWRSAGDKNRRYERRIRLLLENAANLCIEDSY